MNTSISLLTAEEINIRVNGTNSFSRDEIVAHRKEITAARKAKRERLKEMSAVDVSAVIGKHMENGFQVRDTKSKILKTGEKVTVELFKSHKGGVAPLEVSKMTASEIVLALGDKARGVFDEMRAKLAGDCSVDAESAETPNAA